MNFSVFLLDKNIWKLTNILTKTEIAEQAVSEIIGRISYMHSKCYSILRFYGIRIAYHILHAI